MAQRWDAAKQQWVDDTPTAAPLSQATQYGAKQKYAATRWDDSNQTPPSQNYTPSYQTPKVKEPALNVGTRPTIPEGPWGGPPRTPTPGAPPVSTTMPVPGPKPTPVPVPGAPGPAAPPPAAATQVKPQVFQGFTPKYAMEGFDFSREQNTGKSAKDAFAYLANQAPPPPLNNKDALGAWFEQYIKPGMNELGHTINSSGGDGFNFSNWQGTFDVDFGRGAGAEGGALAWQVNDPTAKLSNGAYTPRTLTPAPGTSGPQVEPTDPNAKLREEEELARQAEARGLTRSEAMRYRRSYQPGIQAPPTDQQGI